MYWKSNLYYIELRIVKLCHFLIGFCVRKVLHFLPPSDLISTDIISYLVSNGTPSPYWQVTFQRWKVTSWTISRTTLTFTKSAFVYVSVSLIFHTRHRFSDTHRPLIFARRFLFSYSNFSIDPWSYLSYITVDSSHWECDSTDLTDYG